MSDGKDKRQQIMQGAERVFTDRRFHEITMDEIAQAAAVGKGTIYRYFQDKEDLFFQITVWGLDELCDLVQHSVPGSGPFDERLVAVCEEISAFFQRRRKLFGMIDGEEARLALSDGGIRAKWMEKRKALVASLAVLLKAGAEQGRIRADMPPEMLANYLLGMLRARTRFMADAPETHRRYELLVDLFCNGARARGVEPSQQGN
jgi:AcrR family transcriptional regulator